MSKTRTVRSGYESGSGTGSDPGWNEEFVFRVHSILKELLVSLYHRDEDESGSFHEPGHLLGRVLIPVRSVAEAESQCLAPTWFALEDPKTGKYIKKNCGKILLTLCLRGREDIIIQKCHTSANNKTKNDDEWETPLDADHDIPDVTTPSAPALKFPQKKRLMKVVASRLERLLHNKRTESSRSDASSDLSHCPSDYEDCTD